MLKNKVRIFLQKYNLLNSHNHLLVAFSGGIDSLCLIHLLSTLCKENNTNISAIHINHQWRGQESIDDENFVKNFCSENNILLFIEKLNENLPHTESVAREERYKFFNKVANENNINILITAHTKSDQVETILYRFLKGTGPSGLIGIPEFRSQINGPDIYRPFIDICREDIEKYAKINNLQARIDSSNFDETFLRNKIRHSLLKELKSYNSQIESAILRLSKISYYDDQLINHLIKPVIEDIYIDDQSIDTNKFLHLPEFIKPRIIINLLNNNKIEYDYKLIERLLNDIKNTKLSHCGKKYSIIKNLLLHITQKSIKIISYKPANMIKSSATIVIPGITELEELNIKLKVSEYDSNNTSEFYFPADKSEKAYVDLSIIKTDLTLRTRRPGDIINPLGMLGHMKLKKYLINNHISQDIKDTIPLVTLDNEVLWLAGICINEKIKVINIPTHVFEIIRG